MTVTKHRPLLMAMLLLAAACLLWAALLQAKQGGPPEGTPYAGSENCAACHEDLATSLKATPHGQKAFEVRSAQGCEACHGPGTAHIDKEGDKSLIRSFKTMPSAEASQTCLQCHERGDHALWVGSTHEQRNVGCTECHSVHHPISEKSQLKASREVALCSKCHPNIQAQIMRTSHHPVREGLITCSDCHNPHGSNGPKLIGATTINEKCYECHAEKRGPFLWDHPPVRENCVNCHTPHGSNFEKLLNAKRPYLCQRCHLDTRHPGTLYDAANLPTSDRILNRSCSDCHMNIHGSNHPSGWTFLR